MKFNHFWHKKNLAMLCRRRRSISRDTPHWDYWVAKQTRAQKTYRRAYLDWLIDHRAAEGADLDELDLIIDIRASCTGE